MTPRSLAPTVLFATLLVCAIEAKDPLADCTPKDPERMTQTEIRKCLMLGLNPKWTQVDSDKDGKLSDREIEEFLKLHLIDLGGEPISLERLRDVLVLEPEPGKFGGVLIRDSHEDITLTEEAKGAAKAKGASFSFARDGNKSVSTWIAKGAILRPFRIDDPEAKPSGLDHFLVPSLTFDKSGTSDPTADEANALTPRVFYELEWSAWKFDLSSFRVGLFYATDFDFRSEVGGIETAWEPTILDWGMGQYKHMSRLPFRYMVRSFALGEYGKTYDAGDKTSLVEDESFLRLGGQVELNFRLKKSDRLTIGGSYRPTFGLNGEPDRSALTTAALEVALDPSGRFGLKAEFRNGQLPLTLENVESWTVGLTVKN